MDESQILRFPELKHLSYYKNDDHHAISSVQMVSYLSVLLVTL